MINSELHKQPVALDRNEHRNLKLRPDHNPLGAARHLNAIFLTMSEFGDACRDMPILFLRAGTSAEGKTQIAPVAVLGLAPGENLFIDAQADGQLQWNGNYLPAMLSAYPFAMGQLTPDQWAVCIDRSFAGWSEDEGRALFDDQGEPTPFLAGLRDFVETFENEAQRTRLGGERLMDLGLLEEKRFDATLPDGTPLGVDGFLAVNEKRLNELTDAEAVELHRNGLLGVLFTHQVSMKNMRTLIQRRVNRDAAKAKA